MKNRKKFLFVLIIALIGLLAAVTGSKLFSGSGQQQTVQGGHPTTYEVIKKKLRAYALIVTKKGALPVLMYHAVDDNVFGGKELFVSTEAFEQQIKYLYDNGYTAIDFSEIKNYKKYKKPIIITFDDGYENNYTKAYPILKKYNMKATIFVVSGFIGKNRYLKPEEIKEMGDIISFQSHTANHIKLSEAARDTVEKEAHDSKDAIERITGKPVFVISYPFGAYNKDTVSIVQKQYDFGVNTKFGYYRTFFNPHRINRIGVSYKDSLEEFARKL